MIYKQILNVHFWCEIHRLLTSQEYFFSNETTKIKAVKRRTRSEDEYKCGSGECVSRGARCNNRQNCMDNSDELNCSGSIFRIIINTSFESINLSWLSYKKLILICKYNFKILNYFKGSNSCYYELPKIFKNFLKISMFLPNIEIINAKVIRK